MLLGLLWLKIIFVCLFIFFKFHVKSLFCWVFCVSEVHAWRGEGTESSHFWLRRACKNMWLCWGWQEGLKSLCSPVTSRSVSRFLADAQPFHRARKHGGCWCRAGPCSAIPPQASWHCGAEARHMVGPNTLVVHSLPPALTWVACPCSKPGGGELPWVQFCPCWSIAKPPAWNLLPVQPKPWVNIGISHR